MNYCWSILAFCFALAMFWILTRSFEPSFFTAKLRCNKGKVPWVHLDLSREVQEFYDVYMRRPDEKNVGGGAFFHYFAIWCTIKALKPSIVIESGAHKGVGSWFIRQASGTKTKFICISPKQPSVYVDRHESSMYFTDERFHDFSRIEWHSIVDKQDVNKTLVFFDDHQSALRRMREAKHFGFKHIIFDDNYLPGRGDNLSPKKLCNPSLTSTLDAKLELLDNFGKVRQELSAREFRSLQDEFNTLIQVYAEFPPLWEGPNRFKIEDSVWKSLTMPPLFTKKDLPMFKLDFDEEARRYTHIVYIKLS